MTDKGRGIEEKHLPYLFDRLYVQEDARSRQTEGSGIGLTIVKTLTERMGGQVSVKSISGVETAFTVCLPYEIPQKKRTPESERTKEIRKI